MRRVTKEKSYLRRHAAGRGRLRSPKLSGAAPPNRASRATIAFLESDRPGAPRAGDAYGRRFDTEAGRHADDRNATIWIVRASPAARSRSPISGRRTGAV